MSGLIHHVTVTGLCRIDQNGTVQKYLGNSGATCRLYKIGTAHADSIFKPENDP